MSKKPPHQRSTLPRPDAIENGYYIDFEGFGKNGHGTPPPALLGIYHDDGSGDFQTGFEQVVFTECLKFAAEDPGVSHRVRFVNDRTAYLNKVISKTRKNSPFFAFSEHELTMLAQVTGRRPLKRYRNVRPIAKRWLRRTGTDDSTAKELHSVASAMGFELPQKLPTGGVTSRLRTVSDHASSRTKWRNAPPTAREAWKTVLLHNMGDVKALHEMLHHMQPCAA